MNEEIQLIDGDYKDGLLSLGKKKKKIIYFLPPPWYKIRSSFSLIGYQLAQDTFTGFKLTSGKEN